MFVSRGHRLFSKHNYISFSENLFVLANSKDPDEMTHYIEDLT